MALRFNLRNLFGCLTTVCVIAGLVHGSLYYPEPWNYGCCSALFVLGLLLFFASWRWRRDEAGPR